MTSSKKIASQIDALKGKLSKAEAQLADAHSKAGEIAAARKRAAIEGRELPRLDQGAIEDAETHVHTFREALAEAEAQHAAAVREEEADALRAELKALSKKVAASDLAVPEALGQVIEELSRHLAIAGRMATIGARLRSIGAAFDDPETWGVRPEILVERANARTWSGKAKTRGERAEVVFELHPGDFLA
jgi:chromosome segregation ATPase